ncbi:MAG: RelA/SpoT family protein [Patescibacteria group bacterium]|nr:RelA/SpoT family protein [Patescibacteria group bacterium]MDD5490228.1 RelA/SpoT family protein [Patescibacteria group bacterium]
MQTLNQLTNIIRTNDPGADLDMIELAYEFAEKAHRGQKRLSGEDYIGHPLATAIILAEMKSPIPIIIAGLLHDIPEDTKYTIKDIQDNFGKDIASMVAGITKLGKIKYRGIERYVENLRKMFIAMAADLRVVVIKFADRIHNLTSLKYQPPVKQLRIARESLEIYAPIANRLGMGELKGKLEDLSFPYVYPQEYKWLKKLIASTYGEKEKHLKKVIRLIKKELTKQGFKYISVHGRTKHLYSLYKKLLRLDKDISRVYDLVACRIIVRDIPECYTVLGVIHTMFRPLKGRIKDYIAQPKPNGYQSLHSTVFSPDGEIVEVQIRTQEMHEEAEWGIAAHWHYDEKGSIVPDKKLSWVQELAKIQKEMETKEKFLESLESLKIDVFQDRIFVFTPKGDVIDLPERSTPVDFAYYVHTDIGNKCNGAKINDQIASLDTPLNSGDVVEIIVDKKRKLPNRDWLKFIKTHNAKGKIKTALKEK